MIISDAFEKQKAKEQVRRARVVVLGEFSAGKSTLINLLTGGQKLRTQVTATQMPAVWMSYGSSAPYRVDMQGKELPVDLSDLSDISVSDTAYVRMFMKTPALELCDFIDTPGNSDPNIAASAWERVAEIADVAVWCSPCTQAWRQSELAAWRDVPERVRENSILLLTRADKLTTDADREKVFKRVNREAGDLFSKIHMVSLLKFADARDFLRDLIELCGKIDGTETPAGATSSTAPSSPQNDEDPHHDTSLEELNLSAKDEEVQTPVADQDLEPLAGSVVDDPLENTFAAREVAPIREAPRPGFATALWYDLTQDIAADAPDELNAAFLKFLVRLDQEIWTANNRTAVKAAG